MRKFERILEAPCIFCGYSGPNYFQARTHGDSCPWRQVGGMFERQSLIPEMLADLVQENLRLRTLRTTVRERELETEVARLREANRRLQLEGPALERDKLVRGLRNRVGALKHFYESRFERLQQFAHEELEGEQKRRFFNVVANGTAEWTEQHNWSGRTVSAEGELDSLRAENARLLARCERMTQAQVVAEAARQLLLVEGYDGPCIGEDIEPLMTAVIAYDAAREALAGEEGK
jgi:hypothetical protein